MSAPAKLPSGVLGRAVEVLGRHRLRFVDIGARDGLPRHWDAVGAALDVVAFEPDPAEARRLADSFGRSGASVQVLPAAVWNTAGRRTLYLTRSPGCSSLYEPRAGFLSQFPDARRFEVVERHEVDTVLLDTVLERQPPVRFIKIDAQGGALNILSGATETLASTLGAEIEVELAPMYEGEPLFGEVDAYLRARHFELVDLRPTYWRREAGRRVAGTRGQIVFCDTLYLLSPSAFADRVAAADTGDAEHLCASVLLVCEVYGLTDWAAAYASALADRKLATAMLDEYVAAHRPARLPAFPLRYQLGLWLKDVADGLVESSETWGVAEQRLGSKPRLGRNLAGRIWRRLAKR